MTSPLFPVPPAVGRFRYLLHRVFRIWFYLLNCWANKYVEQIKPEDAASSSDPEFMKTNLSMQSELHRLFLPHYHACLSCGECCMHRVPPRYAVDYLLLGRPERDQLRLSRCSPEQIFQRAVYFLHFTLNSNPGAKEETLPQDDTSMPCPQLTDSGCRLPWGQRYVNCTIYLCPSFCRLMTWGEYWKYMVTCVRYMNHVTLSTGTVISRWKRLKS